MSDKTEHGPWSVTMLSKPQPRPYYVSRQIAALEWEQLNEPHFMGACRFATMDEAQAAADAANSGHRRYATFLCQKGCDPVYLGEAYSLDGALNLMDEHKAGFFEGTPKHLWETAKATGSRKDWLNFPPPHDDEPMEYWGEYVVCRIKAAP